MKAHFKGSIKGRIEHSRGRVGIQDLRARTAEGTTNNGQAMDEAMHKKLEIWK